MKTEKIKQKKTLLKRITLELQRHVDRQEGWNNCNPDTNGEYWLMSRTIPSARIVVDIGANVGDWSQECIRLNPDVELFAFEASPDTARTYEKRFQANSHIHLLNYGLSAEEGMLEFHDYGHNSGLSGFYSRQMSVNRTPDQVIQVPARRLDQVAELKKYDRLDFVKIDTEGGEMNVLRGASSWLEPGKISLLQFEYGGAWIDAREFLADAFSMLTGYGYIFGRLHKKGIFWIDTFDHRILERYKYANFIACSSREEASRLGLLG